MVKQQAKADLVDGKYAVSIGDKAAKDYITTFLGTEEGKAFKAAASTAAAALVAAARRRRQDDAALGVRCASRPSSSTPSPSRKAARSSTPDRKARLSSLRWGGEQGR
jgi:hypothetical protein